MKTRITSAVVLGLTAVVCILLSPLTRVLFFASAGILCVYEFSVCLEKSDIHCTLWVMVLYLVLQAGLTLWGAGLFASCSLFIGCVYLALFSGILRKKVSGRGAIDTVAGLAYPSVLFTALMCISVSDIWLESLVIGCVSSWVCDAFALFGGTRLGKHALAPAVSPKKTWEGSICGAVAALGAGVLLWVLGNALADTARLGTLYSPLPLSVCLVTAFIASTVGQIGDLAESLLKRMMDVKDFSDLIPGHGGMFDRADSLLFAIPTAYFCLRIAEKLL